MYSIKILNFTMVLALLLFIGTFAVAQDYSVYLDAAMSLLDDGDCVRAEMNYNVYKELTGKTSSEIEKRIMSCKGVDSGQQPLEQGPEKKLNVVEENISNNYTYNLESYDCQKEKNNEPKQIKVTYINYEVLPCDLDGTYTWEDANNACANLTAFGKSDWYLPNRSELDALYERKNKIGGFTDGWYWCATELGSGNSGYVWEQRFSDGSQHYTEKYLNLHVRCVRKY